MVPGVNGFVTMVWRQGWGDVQKMIQAGPVALYLMGHHIPCIADTFPATMPRMARMLCT